MEVKCMELCRLEPMVFVTTYAGALECSEDTS